MKIFAALIACFSAASALAAPYDCKLTSLESGQAIRDFVLQAPGQGRILTTLPGGRYRIMVWTYEASIGVEIDELPSQSTELSTQMTFGNDGIFDLTSKAADLRLTCESER